MSKDIGLDDFDDDNGGGYVLDDVIGFVCWVAFCVVILYVLHGAVFPNTKIERMQERLAQQEITIIKLQNQIYVAKWRGCLP